MAQKTASWNGSATVPVVSMNPPTKATMADVPRVVSLVGDSSRELESISLFIERAVVFADVVNTMSEAVDKLAFVVYAIYVGYNATISVDILEPLATE